MQNIQSSIKHYYKSTKQVVVITFFFLEQMDKDKNISDVLDIYKKHSFSSHDEMVAAFYMRRCKKIKSFENPQLLFSTE